MKVDILIPKYRAYPPPAEDAQNAMFRWAHSHGVDVRIPTIRGNALLHRVRNLALTQVRPDATHVLFCDDDMAPPADALNQLLGHGVPVVSAFCTTREEFPPKVAAKWYDREQGRFFTIESVGWKKATGGQRRGSLVTGDFGVGGAFLLMEMAVVRRLTEYFLSAEDWLADNRELLDRLGVPCEASEAERRCREVKRRTLYSEGDPPRVFFYGTQDSNDLDTGEDIFLSAHLLQLGIPVAIDSGLEVLHVGYFGYGPRHLGVQSADEIRMTA